MKKKVKFKIGECWDFYLGEDVGDYWHFEIVGNILFKGDIYWIAVKHNAETADELWPIIIDEYGCDQNLIGEAFHVKKKSRVKSRLMAGMGKT